MSILRSPVRGADDAVALARALAPDGDVEGMLVVGLDRGSRLCGVALNPQRRALSFMKVWELEALVAELDASSLVVMLFPTGECRAPNVHELDTFRDLARRAHRARVRMLDAIVVRGHRWWSLRELDRARATHS